MAFQSLRQVTAESGFPTDYIDTAFNDCVFVWDSVFILQFARYGTRVGVRLRAQPPRSRRGGVRTDRHDVSQENDDPAQPAKREFVGWGGVPPVAVLLEYVFGFRPDPLENLLVWDIRLTNAFGVERYPFPRDCHLDIHCEARQDSTQEPQITVTSNVSMTVEVRWDGGRKRVQAFDQQSSRWSTDGNAGGEGGSSPWCEGWFNTLRGVRQ